MKMCPKCGEACFTSFWDNGITVGTGCTVNLSSMTVYNIAKAEVTGVNVLKKQTVTLNCGLEFDAYNEEEYKNLSEEERKKALLILE